MRITILATATLALLGSGAVAQAGCISGAIVGGIAGHMAGHGKLGAAAGCAVGHHNAKEKQQKASAPQQSEQTPPK